jgi:hypothetical protein
MPLQVGHFVRYHERMLSKHEFTATLEYLGLSASDLATLFDMDARSTRRWVEDPSAIPGPAEQALRAWVRLQRLGLAWRPDGIAIGERNPEKLAEQIKAHARYAVDLDAVLRRVDGRGGPAAPWDVDLGAHQATLGPVCVFFYPLANGGFSPACYTRRDRPPDLQRDWSLIEDALACVAKAVAAAGPQWSRPPEGQSALFETDTPLPSQRAQDVLDLGERSFRRALEDHKELTAEERAAFAAGSQEIAVAIEGSVPDHSTTERFLDLMLSANPLLRPDWPLWLDTRPLQDRRFAPKVVNKAWQAFAVFSAGTVPWDLAEFSRLDPKGTFYLRRMIDDDTYARVNKVPAGKFLDPQHVIARTAEAIAVSLAFARAMGCSPEDTKLDFRFRWTKLRDRIIHSSTGAGRFLPPRSQYTSAEDDASGTIEVPLNTADSALAPYVARATATLFAQFGGFEPPVGFTGALVQKLMEKR